MEMSIQILKQNPTNANKRKYVGKLIFFLCVSDFPPFYCDNPYFYPLQDPPVPKKGHMRYKIIILIKPMMLDLTTPFKVVP